MVSTTDAETAVRHDFGGALARAGVSLRRAAPEILQLNVGKLCNLTCGHCHVNAGPERKEIMTGETIDRILEWFEKTEIGTLDLTGGTPEMVPDFRRLVEAVRGFPRPRRVMDRLNATILDEPGYEWVADFLAEHEVEIVASMPCYEPENVNAQRGEGVFDSSISAFQKLNALGYGRDPGLRFELRLQPERWVFAAGSGGVEGGLQGGDAGAFRDRLQRSLLHREHADRALCLVPEAGDNQLAEYLD